MFLSTNMLNSDKIDKNAEEICHNGAKVGDFLCVCHKKVSVCHRFLYEVDNFL